MGDRKKEYEIYILHMYIYVYNMCIYKMYSIQISHIYMETNNYEY